MACRQGPDALDPAGPVERGVYELTMGGSRSQHQTILQEGASLADNADVPFDLDYRSASPASLTIMRQWHPTGLVSHQVSIPATPCRFSRMHLSISRCLACGYCLISALHGVGQSVRRQRIKGDSSG